MDKDVFKRMIKLFFPIFIEFLLIILLTTADTFMLSRYDELCVDAVGTANQAIQLLQIFIIISSNGVAIVVGQFLGAKKEDDAKRVLSQGVIFNLILGIILMTIFLLSSKFLLKLINAKDDFFSLANDYMIIYAIGLPFLAVSQVIYSNFRAYGKPLPMTIVSLISNIINVILNYFLIFGIRIFPELGIKGAAIATLASIIFKFVMGIILNKKMIGSPLLSRKIDKEILKDVMRIGAPSAFESIFYTISQFILVAALNLLSNDDITAKVYLNTILQFSLMFYNALGSTNQVIVANYAGSHEYDKAKRITIKVALFAESVLIVLVTFMVIFVRPLYGIFTSNEGVINSAAKVMPLIFILESGRCLNYVVLSAEKSAGDVIFPLVMGIIVMFTVGASGSWLLAHVFKMGLAGILLAQGLDEFIRGICAVIRWFSNKWQNKSIVIE